MSGADELLWWYKDSTGSIFGPFPQGTMRGWFEAGHFPMGGELEVRHTDQEGPYTQIKELFGEPIADKAFRGQPKDPAAKRQGGGGGGGGKRGGGGTGNRNQNNSGNNVAPNMGNMGMMPGMDMMGGMGMMGYGMPGMGGGMAAGMPGMMGMAGMGMMGMGMPMPGMGMTPGTGRFLGRIKSFNQQKGFGFVECPEAHAVYNRDVFLHKAQIGTFQIGSTVSFAVEMNKQNMPQARDLRDESMSMGMMMGGMGMGMGGMGMGGGMKGNKGGGKGRGGGNKNANAKSKPKAQPKSGGKSPEQLPATDPVDPPPASV